MDFCYCIIWLHQERFRAQFLSINSRCAYCVSSRQRHPPCISSGSWYWLSSSHCLGKFADFMTKNQFLASWQLESSSARKLLTLVTKKSASPALLLTQLVNPRITQHSEGPSTEVFVQYGASTTLPTTCKEWDAFFSINIQLGFLRGNEHFQRGEISWPGKEGS